MNENQILESMVKALRSRPAEWMTFAYLASLIGIPGCNANLIGALADYRPDLFAVTKDRKLKLRLNVARDIAIQGAAKWQVPAPQPVRLAGAVRRVHDRIASEESANACYCVLSDEDVLADLKEGSIPDEALVFSCCWKKICRVRGLFFNLVSAETWIEICRKRGYILQRENPRGF